MDDDYLILKGDLATIVGWVKGQVRATTSHPLLHDIWKMLQDCTSPISWHIFCEVNSAFDLFIFFVAENFGEVI